MEHQVAIDYKEVDLTPSSRALPSRHPKQIHRIKARTVVLDKSFTPRTIPQWNDLSDTVACAVSATSLKRQLAAASKP